MFKNAFTHRRLMANSKYHRMNHKNSKLKPLFAGILSLIAGGLIYQTALDMQVMPQEQWFAQTTQKNSTTITLSETIQESIKPSKILLNITPIIPIILEPTKSALSTEIVLASKSEKIDVKVAIKKLATKKKPTPEIKTKSQPAITANREQPKKVIIKAKKDRWLEATVKSGDSISAIFYRLGLSAKLLDKILRSDKKAKQLKRISPGQQLRVHMDKNNQFVELEYKLSRIKNLHISSTKTGFKTKIQKKALITKTTELSTTITNSLYLSAKKAGLTNSMIMELTNIFRWDIDFARNIKAGDTFNIIFEEKLLNGKKYKNGPILAAEFNNQGKIYRAVAYKDKKGKIEYYTPQGKSLKKTFLQAPVDFSRISSRFTKSRKHPVYGRKRAHNGVDYAASTGTPIRAMADGKVNFRGRQRGYGNVVILKHEKKYTTLYAHMSRFRSKVKKGSWVKQGQSIGYVGMSGTATGPHLHYEFRVNGKHKNPLTHKIPGQQVIIAKGKRVDFNKTSKNLLARLDKMNNTMVASAGTGSLNIQ